MENDHSGNLLTPTMRGGTQAPPTENGQCVINRLLTEGLLTLEQFGCNFSSNNKLRYLIAGNFHLILVKIFLYLDGRTLTSASKVGSCEAHELLNAV